MFRVKDSRYIHENESKFKTLDSEFKVRDDREYFVDLQGEEIISYAEVEIERELYNP